MSLTLGERQRIESRNADRRPDISDRQAPRAAPEGLTAGRSKSYRAERVAVPRSTVGAVTWLRSRRESPRPPCTGSGSSATLRMEASGASGERASRRRASPPPFRAPMALARANAGSTAPNPAPICLRIAGRQSPGRADSRKRGERRDAGERRGRTSIRTDAEPRRRARDLQRPKVLSPVTCNLALPPVADQKLKVSSTAGPLPTE